MAVVVIIKGRWKIKKKLTMQMVRTAYIVPRNDRYECSSTIGACGLDSTESVGRNSRSRAIAIAPSLHASVDTGRVCSPHLDVGIGDRHASRNVDDVDV